MSRVAAGPPLCATVFLLGREGSSSNTTRLSGLAGRSKGASRRANRTNVSIRCNTGEKKRVVIVGAGPAGLLTAHYLLREGGFEVQLFEARGDPRKENPSSFRQYSLGLGARGRHAIQARPGTPFDEPPIPRYTQKPLLLKTVETVDT
jgi:hypothetical protein